MALASPHTSAPHTPCLPPPPLPPASPADALYSLSRAALAFLAAPGRPALKRAALASALARPNPVPEPYNGADEAWEGLALDAVLKARPEQMEGLGLPLRAQAGLMVGALLRQGQHMQCL